MRRNQKKRRQLTEKELTQLEAWSAVRVPFENICQLLEIAATDLRELSKKNDAVRRALEGGRSKATYKVRRTLYNRAVGRPAIIDEKTGEVVEEAIPVDIRALEFWCKTQEGFKSADRLEVSGPDGAPIESRTVTKDELKARVLALRKANDLTEDE